MAKLNADGLSVLDEFLDSLGVRWEPVAKQGLYEGAAVMKDALLREVESLPTTSRDKFVPAVGLPLSALRPKEKQGLINGLGVSKMRRDGDGISVSIAFDGYNELGKANSLVARSLNKGTSVQKPNRFVSRAFKVNENKRVKAIVDKINSIKIQSK